MWTRWHCLCDSPPNHLASDTHKISVYLSLILCAEILELMLFIHIARSVLIWVQMGQKSPEDGGSRYKSQWYGFITKGIFSYFWVWLRHSRLQQVERFSCVGFLPRLWKTIRACVVLQGVNMPSFLFCSVSCLSWFALRIVRDSNPAFFSSEMDKMYCSRGDIYHLTGLWSSEALDDRVWAGTGGCWALHRQWWRRAAQTPQAFPCFFGCSVPEISHYLLLDVLQWNLVIVLLLI